jgi:hypothetical protein
MACLAVATRGRVMATGRVGFLRSFLNGDPLDSLTDRLRVGYEETNKAPSGAPEPSARRVSGALAHAGGQMGRRWPADRSRSTA